jgi:putative nucleotidyltransferase with HDIG domain
MQINCTPEENQLLEQIAKVAQSLSVETYVIGGFVRDKILGRNTKDIDIVCVGDGIQLAEAFAKSLHPKAQVAVYKNFGTAQVKTDTFEVEFVGARKESYRSESRNPAVEQGTLVDDQNRRDLSINAMAISLNAQNYGTLIDPFDGMNDLQSQWLRTPLDPVQTFIDDPLRMMRTIRFAAQLDFTVDPIALSAITENAARIDIISQERITDELNKIILCKKPSIGFLLLYQTKLLHRILPQMVDLAGAEYIDGKGHKDNFHHTLQVLDNICEDTDNLYLRWAAILHDIAKPATKKFEAGKGWTFHGHEWLGAKMVPSIFKRLKLPLNEPMKYVQKLVQLHLRPISLTKEDITDSAIRRLLFDAGNDIDDLMTLCKADITSKNEKKVKRFRENFNLVKKRIAYVEENDMIRNWQPPISGEIIMETFGLSPSRAVGDIKTAVREAILDGVIRNNYDEAYAYMILKAKELNIAPKL